MRRACLCCPLIDFQWVLMLPTGAHTEPNGGSEMNSVKNTLIVAAIAAAVSVPGAIAYEGDTLVSRLFTTI